ncbi:MAG: ABC transporter ATP-binding protein [Oscillospiraceae bacterium]|nr:ABC transporter ATP-binding protein [Oscillospiraceae bacterium]
MKHGVVLQATNLCKSFTNGTNTSLVLQNLNLEISRGDFTVIMGSSGSGKSTLLYCLSGMDKVTSGEVRYSDYVFTNMKEDDLAALRRSNMGFVFQQIHLIQNLNIFENIVISGYLNRKSAVKDIHNKAQGLIEKMGLIGSEKKFPNQLSGGQQQRTAIARALINSPNLLFADEPTGALNSSAGQAVLNILSEENQNGQSILMVTHDIKCALRANRIIYLKDGIIIGELKLEPFTETDLDTREVNVLNWLKELGW